MSIPFVSEQKAIENSLHLHGLNCDVERLDIACEVIAPPRTKSHSRFNNDFSLFLKPPDEWRNIKCFGEKVLPNSSGVDLFVTVDEETSYPLLVELLGGEAFPIKWFREHIDRVECVLEALSRPVTLRRACYCRVLVIGGVICFLAFPFHDSPVRGIRASLICENDDARITCAVKGAEVLYVDGWIKTKVDANERKLEAVSVSA